MSDVVGVELGAGLSAGCPAVRLRRHKGIVSVASVGFVAAPNGELPATWDDLRHQPKWGVPSAFRAECAALAVNSPSATTRQTTLDALVGHGTEAQEGVATSKDGMRSVYKRMSDSASALHVTIPEYQALWLNRLLPEGHRPTAVSVQTAPCALLCALCAQPQFCETDDEVAVFVTQSQICIAGFRRGIPLLFREYAGAAGAAAMREAIKRTLGLDETMLDTVFSANGIIDTRPALEPLLSPVVSQIELSLDYLRNRLGASPKRLFLMGDAAGCNALQRILSDRLAIPLATPNPFAGLELPVKPVVWKERYCRDDRASDFLVALGAALAVLQEVDNPS